MANQNLPNTSLPVDQAISAGPGVAFRESDFPYGGAASAEAVGLYGEVGQASGNRGWAGLPPRRALSNDAASVLKGGK